MTPLPAAVLPAAVAFALAASGCGDEDRAGSAGGAGGVGEGPPTLAIVSGAPTPLSAEPKADPYVIDGYTSVMAANGALVVVGTSTSVYELGADAPVRLDIVGDEPDLPLATGPVRAAAPYADGALVAAESALFFTAGGALQLSAASGALHPLGIDVLKSRIADDDGDGVNESHVSIVSKGGVFELEPGSMVAWSVDGEAGEPTAILSQKSALFLAFGSRVYEVDKASGKAQPLAFDIGSVREIACASAACDEGSLIYFASDRGVVERSADGRYTLYPLAEAGQAAVPVETFALDGAKQRLYAVAGPWIMRIRAGERPDVVATVGEASAARSLAVDKRGDAWMGQASELAVRKIALGTPLSFATDVRPIMHEYCAGCHAAAQNGAPKLDFEAYDVTAGLVKAVLGRITQGTMPPATYSKKLPKEKIELVQEWAVDKAQ